MSAVYHSFVSISTSSKYLKVPTRSSRPTDWRLSLTTMNVGQLPRKDVNGRDLPCRHVVWWRPRAAASTLQAGERPASDRTPAWRRTDQTSAAQSVSHDSAITMDDDRRKMYEFCRRTCSGDKFTAYQRQTLPSRERKKKEKHRPTRRIIRAICDYWRWAPPSGVWRRLPNRRFWQRLC